MLLASCWHWVSAQSGAIGAQPPIGSRLMNMAIDAPSLEVGGGRCDVVWNAEHRVEECRELLDLDRLCISGKNGIFVAHLHFGGAEITCRIGKAERSVDRH